MLRRLPILIVVCLAAVAVQSSRAQSVSGPDLPFRWEGSVTVSRTFEPSIAFMAADWTGSFRDERRINVLARESRRAEVKDAAGRVVGEVFWLEDGGTTWSGSVADTETHLGTIRMLGDQAGTGPAQLYGVVYRSLVEPNPFGGALPDGSYCLMVIAAPIRYQYTLRQPGRSDEVEMLDSQAGLIAGDCSLSRRLAGSGPLTVASVTASLSGPSLPGEMSEGRRRALEDGMMRGTYRQVEEGNTDHADWSLRRRRQIAGRLAEADPAWRPTFLGRTSVTASIDPAYGLTGRFRFTLFDLSREPGQSVNSGEGTGLDLRFADDQPVPMSRRTEMADGWTIETDEVALDATVSIVALDYGAWGRLKAEVNVDGEWYPCLTASSAASVTLPLDTNTNHIWDTWERRWQVWGRPAAEDVDDLPESAVAGDGFSNYEEYRGFMVGPDWVSLDPHQKNLFVFDEAGEGIGLFGASGVVTYLIEQQQYDANRVVNMNRGHATAGPQKGLRLAQGSLDPGTMGLASPMGPPNRVRVITIDLSQIGGSGDVLESVIGHELGHGVGIPHHGDYSEDVCGEGPKGLIALWRGAYSGDRDCLMSYPSATYYRSWNNQCHAYTWESAWGKSFCTAKTGTGYNAGPRRVEDGHPMPVSGDASHGNCQHALRLK